MPALYMNPHSAIPLFARCAQDETTRIRLQLDPYYKVVDRVRGSQVEVDGRWMVMMSSNEYLGLSQHPKVLEAGRRALEEWGAGSCGSRLANGSRRCHRRLEEKLAAFLGQEDCQILAAGYLACMASVSCIATRGDALIVDKSIHSALWDGARLSGATIERFAHDDPASLSEVLRVLDPGQAKLIVVDGVYSMEGHIASLKEISALAREHRAFLVVDDAHGLGVLGKDGRGVVDHCGVQDDVQLISGSFSKSLASTGGFLAGPRAVLEYLRTHAKQIIFSAAITPAAAACAEAALEVVQTEPGHRERLWDNTRHFRGLLDAAGLDYWSSPTPAVPIVIGSTLAAVDIWREMWEQGFFTVISVSPGVPAGKDLLRCAVSAHHQKEDLDRFVEALVRACRKRGVGFKA